MPIKKVMIPSISITIASHNAAKLKAGISARIPRINKIIPITIEPIFVIFNSFLYKEYYLYNPKVCN